MPHLLNLVAVFRRPGASSSPSFKDMQHRRPISAHLLSEPETKENPSNGTVSGYYCIYRGDSSIFPLPPTRDLFAPAKFARGLSLIIAVDRSARFAWEAVLSIVVNGHDVRQKLKKNIEKD